MCNIMCNINVMNYKKLLIFLNRVLQPSRCLLVTVLLFCFGKIVKNVYANQRKGIRKNIHVFALWNKFAFFKIHDIIK